MADTYTTNLNLTKPEPGAAEDTWGISLNSDLDTLDAIFSSSGTQVNLNPNQVNFADGKKSIFGTGSDLEIYHDGSNSYVRESGTGELRVQGTNLRLMSTSHENYLTALENAGVRLWYDNNIKLTTTSTGIDVTGTVTSDGLTVDSGSSDIAIVFDDDNVTNRYKFTTGGNSFDSFFDVNSGSSRAAHVRAISGSVYVDIASGFSRNDINFYNADLFIKRSSTKALEVDHSTGDISFYDDTGTTQGLFWDASTERLGIGTTSPQRKLHVIDDAIIDGASGANLYFRPNTSYSGSGNFGIFTTGLTSGTYESTMTIKGYGSGVNDVMTIKGLGNVGIGTSSPASKLHIQGSGTTVAQITGGASNVAGIYLGDTGGIANGRLSYSNADNSLQLFTNGSEKVRITSGGSVGIGTSSPNAPLHIANGTPTIRLEDTSAGVSHYLNSNNAEFRVQASGALALYTAGNNRVHINNTGSVGIGTSSPSDLLHIADTSANNLVTMRAENSLGYAEFGTQSNYARILQNNTLLYAGSSSETYFYNGGTTAMALTSTGLGIGTTSPSGLLEISADSDDGTSAPSFLITNASTTLNDGAVVGTIEFRNSDASGTPPHTAKIQGIANASDERTTELAFSTGSVGTTTERLRIASDGSVGIGTDSPSSNSKLHINDSSTSDSQYTLHLESYAPTIVFEDVSGGTQDFSIQANTNALTFSVGDATTGTKLANEKLRLTSAGNVGIGTSSPTNSITTTGALEFTGNAFNGSGTGVWSPATNELGFVTSGSTQVRINSSGSVGIGTSSPSAFIHTEGTSNGTETYAKFSTGSLAGDQILTVKSSSARNHMALQVNAGGGAVDDLALNPDGGNVGIGTGTPSQNLHIEANNPAIQIKDTSTTGSIFVQADYASSGTDVIRSDTNNLGLYADGAVSIKFSTNGSERARIDSSGNVGINTSSPSEKLHVEGRIRLGTTPAVVSHDNITIDIDQNNNSGSNYFRVTHDGESSELLRVQENGNVGIGTAFPGSTLDVTNASGQAGIDVDSYTNNNSYISFKENGISRFSINHDTSGNALTFYNSYGSSEAMRIDASGNLFVGTTTLNDVNGIVNGHLFEAASTTAGEGAVGVYNNTGTANCPALLVLNRDGSTDSTNRFVQFYADVTSSGATAMGGIVGNGASNVQFATLSDEREKENITPVDNVLNKLINLNVVSFDWKKNDEHVKAGFIAQNVEEHFPEYVIENIANDGEESRKGTTGGMSAGYIAVLTKAIQEQQEQIESLKSEIAKLKGE